jgi:repressor LexA
MKELTNRQAEIHDFMVCWQRDNGFPPSQEEIRDNFGFSSLNAVRSHLTLIAKKGFICLNAGKARGIQLKTSARGEIVSSDESIPIIGSIAAGEPILAEQNIENLLAIPRALFGGGELFALHVKGNSMVQAGIMNGDVAIIRKQSHVENGEIGAVLLGQEATLKRVFLTSGSLRLKAENPTCDDLIYNESSIESPRVIGRYQGIVRTTGLGSVL